MLTIKTNSEDPTVGRRRLAELRDTLYQNFPISNTSALNSYAFWSRACEFGHIFRTG